MSGRERDMRHAVLDVIQGAFPLERDPYGALASQLGFDRRQVLEMVAGLREDGTIRRIGASFSSQALGYASTLCALAVCGGAKEVDRVAGLVNAYPQVTHNYLRDDRYNLWFTIVAPGRHAVDALFERIVEEAGCTDALNLPAEALYKIRADFRAFNADAASAKRSEPSPGGPQVTCAGASSCSPADGAENAGFAGNQGVASAHDPRRHLARARGLGPAVLTGAQRALVRWAQGDVSGTEPFADAAAFVTAQTGRPVDEGWVLDTLRAWKADGTLRRFGAMVRHRFMGYLFNGMIVLDVPVKHVDEVGRALASFTFVSHCYARPRTAMWPYNLYAMVHAKSRDELDAFVNEIALLVGSKPKVLVSTKEYKKTSPTYFSEM